MQREPRLACLWRFCHHGANRLTTETVHTGCIARVALDLPLPGLFDYLAGDASETDVGRLVRVPFGRSEKTALLVELVSQSEVPRERLKPLASVLRELPPLPADWQALCQFASRYYHHPYGQVVALALPPLLRRGRLPRRKPAGGQGPVPTPPPPLTGEQRDAVAAIAAARGFAVFLLHGVTGSGKTEVYLHAIEAVLADGGQALMLVPEIALTPQLTARVQARFPDRRLVAAHSGVAEAARAHAFVAAWLGEADIVLGTRLAVFMPLPRLALIVIDEEHDPSFKQQDGLRYSARDLAIWRASSRGIAVVLGSATPALESYHHALAGRYHLLPLRQRAVAQTLPTVRLIDTRRQTLQDGCSIELLQAIEQRLMRGEQSLIFLNRRGYAPVLACPACGWISRCRRCAANLVVHLADRRLRCHHCGFEVYIPRACPDCGNVDIHPFGRGTQRLEQNLASRFPEARILRIDRDSANTPARWQALLAAIHEGAADLLIGTQMLAKGHDFPRLTLVGVLSADAALYAADFRAPERLFAQLMQVGGRSGRHDLPGEVLIQTEVPEHPLYQALQTHDYERHAALLLEERRSAGFPPYSHQALLRAEAPAIEQALGFLSSARALAEPLADEVTLYDAVPMRMVRLMNLERAQLLIEARRRPPLQSFLTRWLPMLATIATPRALRWHIDVDPLEL